MKIRIGFRDEVKATLESTGDTDIQYSGEGANCVRRIAQYYSHGVAGVNLLRLLLKKLRGHWWAEEVKDGEEVTLGMVGDEWHGPNPPSWGKWTAIQPGPRGGKRWKRVQTEGGKGGGRQPEQPEQPRIRAIQRARRPDAPVDNVGSKEVEREAGRPSDEVTGGERTDTDKPSDSGAGSVTGQEPVKRAGPKLPDLSKVTKIDEGFGKYSNYFRRNGYRDAADWVDTLRKHVRKVGTERALESLGEETEDGSTERVAYKGTGYFEGDYEKDAKFLKRYLDSVGITLQTGNKPASNLRTIVSAPKQLEKGDIKSGDIITQESNFQDKLEESKHLPGLETSEDIHKLVGHEVTQFTPDVIAKLDETYGKDKWIVKSYGDEAYAGFGIFFPQRVAEIQRSSKETLWNCNKELNKLGYSLYRSEGKEGNVSGIKDNRTGQTYKFGLSDLSGVKNKKVIKLANIAAASAPQEKGTHLPTSPEDSLRQDYGILLEKGEDGKVVGVTDDEGNYIEVGSKKWNNFGVWDSFGQVLERAVEAVNTNQPRDTRFMVQPAFEAVGVTQADRALGQTWETSKEGRVHISTRDGKASVVPFATLAGRADSFPVVFRNPDIAAMEKAVQDAIDQLPESERQGQVYAPDVMKTKDGWRVVELNAAQQGGQSLWLEENPFVIDAFVSHVVGREPAHASFIRKLLQNRMKVGAYKPPQEARGKAFSTDVQGHEHRGKGPGGGQFVSKGGGGSSAGTPSKTLLKIGKLKIVTTGSKPKVDESDISSKSKKPDYVSKSEHKKAVQKALEKMKVVPKPTDQEVQENQAGIEEIGANKYRRNLVGNTGDRKRRRDKLLKEFGDGTTCPCLYCGPRIGHGTMEQDKIYTTSQGGRYRLPNLVPACKDCNRRRGDMPFKDALEKVTRYVGTEE